MKLWREDSDNNNIRQLRSTILTGEGLFTNLINSGNPLALRQQSFLDSIHKHVVTGWSQSHFLSFSKSRQIACGFAIGHSSKTLQLSYQQQWDTLVAVIDLVRLTHVNSIDVGIDHYSFQECGPDQQIISVPPMLQIARQMTINNRRNAGFSPIRNIVTIDVYAHLSHLETTGSSVSQNALMNSQNQQEVLVMPIDPIYGGGVGATALIDLGCVIAVEFFQLI